MTAVRCPRCGGRHATDHDRIIETRTVGLTDDWETWERLTCRQCGEPFIYRIE